MFEEQSAPMRRENTISRAQLVLSLLRTNHDVAPFLREPPTPTRLVWVRIPNTPPIPFFGAFDEYTEGLSVSSTFDRGSLSVDIDGLTDVQAP